MTSPSAIPLLNQIGFHFQPGSSSTLNPQVVYPQWDPDASIQPVQQALMGLKGEYFLLTRKYNLL